jgi:hypothetical protein
MTLRVYLLQTHTHRKRFTGCLERNLHEHENYLIVIDLACTIARKMSSLVDIQRKDGFEGFPMESGGAEFL